MEFPPGTWDLFPAAQFDTAAVRSPGELGMELLVQIRDTGRIQDHYKLVLGGNKLLNADLRMRDLFRVVDFPDWTIIYSRWPADVVFNRNRTTTTWESVNGLIQSRDVVIIDADGQKVKHEDVLAALDDQKAPTGLIPYCAVRWGVGIGDGGKMLLSVQCLPTSAEFLNGRPLTKG